VEQGEVNGLATIGLPVSDIEGDGSWEQKKARAATAPRRGHVSAYDTARGRLVVWGGETDGGLNSDTWEWDGTQWTKIDPPDPEGDGAPQQQELWAPSAMVYDAARGEIILFHRMETWAWKGTSWVKRAGYGCTGPWCLECTSTTCPLLRYGQAMAYDTERAKVVLYGGTWSSGEDKTWEWDGERWTKVTPTDPESDGNPPKIASGHAMVYDDLRGVVVLFAAGTGWNETWEWNGVSWVKRTGSTCTTTSCYVCTSTTCPSPRYLHAMAYDGARGRVVQFGGYYYDGWNQSCNDETWEWDGMVWTKRTPDDPGSDGNPDAMREHAMAYDTLHKKVVLFGGYILYGGPVNILWEWDGASWAKKSPQAADVDGDPSARDTHEMAYDSDRGKVVLFGGYSLSGSVNDTWEWDGSDWVKRAGDSCATGSCYVCAESTCPSARYQHAMAYDAERKRTVLFGGYAFSCDGASNACRDTWEWNGTVWEKKSPSGDIPSGRYSHAMSYYEFDETHYGVLLFAGQNASSVTNNETWEWNGTAWTQRAGDVCVGGSCYVCVIPTGMSDPAATCSKPREGHVMAFDAVRKKVVSFGGWTSAGMLTPDLWEWNGTIWVSKVPVVPKPSDNKYMSAMVYDADREKMLLFGGQPQSASFDNETWEWSGLAWKQKAPADPEFDGIPPSRKEHAMAYDTKRGRAVLFGGDNGGKNGDTWEWNGGTTARTGHIMEAAFGAAVTDETPFTVKKVTARFYAGGVGYFFGVETPGAELKVWDEGRWQKVDDNAISPAALNSDPESGILEWTTESEAQISRLFFGEERRLNFAVTPMEANGTGAGKIATDYAEVIVRYTITE
ncbi:MAG TPA: hypothetical protein PKH10_01715, partial [bacterium]|nr:hypothetical protein [bacterium]